MTSPAEDGHHKLRLAAVKSTVEAILHSDEQSVTHSTNPVHTAIADKTAAQPVGRSARLPGQICAKAAD